MTYESYAIFPLPFIWGCYIEKTIFVLNILTKAKFSHLTDCFHCQYLLILNKLFFLKLLVTSKYRNSDLLNFSLLVHKETVAFKVFCKKIVLKFFAKFTGKHLCQSFFFNEVAGLKPTTLD